jgi:hypothetical protein
MKEQTNRLSTLSKVLILGIFVLALTNAYLHNPDVGYDADDYLEYIETVAHGSLPEKEWNDEFFTPPLPFILPALLEIIFHFPFPTIFKIAQFINALFAFGSVLLIARICNRLSNGSDSCRELAIAFILILPVFYKTHAFVRADPYLLFFILLYIEQLVRIANRKISLPEFSILSGLAFGAVMLSRQWGVLILPSVFLFAFLLLRRERESWKRLLAAFAISGVIAFLLSGWFYISLYNRYGSFTPFNREPNGQFILRNNPRLFYIGTGGRELFTNPIRDSFDSQVIPILYSETWGDYWCYFLVYGKEVRSGDPVAGGFLRYAIRREGWESRIDTNRFEIASYLGRVNAISLLPTGIAIVSAGWGVLTTFRGINPLRRDPLWIHITLFTAIILSTLVGYAWFLIRYPNFHGDTIKTSYIIQIFPLIALLIGLLGERVSRRRHWIRWLLLATLLLTMLHNASTFVTRYTF